jgi:hypothetical protein
MCLIGKTTLFNGGYHGDIAWNKYIYNHHCQYICYGQATAIDGILEKPSSRQTHMGQRKHKMGS